MIDKTKQYRTRDGREVRIYATDGREPASVVHGAVNSGDGWVPYSWFANGIYRYGSDGIDLIEVKPRIKREVWVNVYPDHVTVHDAVGTYCPAGGGGRIACVRYCILDGDIQ